MASGRVIYDVGVAFNEANSFSYFERFALDYIDKILNSAIDCFSRFLTLIVPNFVIAVIFVYAIVYVFYAIW